MKKRNYNLDLIKCISCLGVVGLHSVGMINYTVYYLCGFSVPFFFMANGYLMFSKEKIDYNYVFRKILNILRIVFLWNLLITLPVMVFRHKLVNPFSQCIGSLFQKGYLWHFWFFGSLIILYLMLPLLHKSLKDHPLLHCILCLLLAFICATFSILSMCKGYSLQMFIPQTLRLWTWLFFFLWGGLCADPSFFLNIRFPLWLHGVLVFLLTIVSNIIQKKAGLYLIHNRLADLFYDNITSLLWYTLLFTFLLRIPVKETVSHLITLLESLTTGIFILHPILLAGISRFYSPADTAGAVLFWLFLTVISGICSYVLLKIPCIRTFIKL